MGKSFTLSKQTILKLYKAKIELGKRNTFRGNEALLIWQYVRFNESYQRQFDYFKRNGADHDSFPNSWGMNIPLDYFDEDIPPGFIFQNISFYALKIEDIEEFDHAPKILSSVFYEMSKCKEQYFSEAPPIVLVIDHLIDEKLATEQLKDILRKDGFRQGFKPSAKGKTIKASALKNLVDNLLCYFLREHKGLTAKEIKNDLKQTLGLSLTLSGNALSRKVSTFKKYSKLSPNCFFQLPS